jgi:hypothetical protein
MAHSGQPGNQCPGYRTLKVSDPDDFESNKSFVDIETLCQQLSQPHTDQTKAYGSGFWGDKVYSLCENRYKVAQEHQPLSLEETRENLEVEREVGRVMVQLVNGLLFPKDTDGLDDQPLHHRAGIWEPVQPVDPEDPEGEADRQALRKCPRRARLFNLVRSQRDGILLQKGETYAKIYLGTLVREGERFKAELFLHRFCCWLANGKPPDNKQMATHECGRKFCLRLSCLRWGHARSNRADHAEAEQGRGWRKHK